MDATAIISSIVGGQLDDPSMRLLPFHKIALPPADAVAAYVEWGGERAFLDPAVDG